MSTSFTEVYDINSQHSIEIQSITHIAESFKQNYQKFWAMTFVVTAIYGTEKILCSNNQIKATFLVAFHVNIKTNILTSSKMTIWSEITGIINAPMPPKLGNTVQRRCHQHYFRKCRFATRWGKSENYQLMN